jgi:hypothetical protein
MSQSINDVITRPIDPAIMILGQLTLARRTKSRKVAGNHLQAAGRLLMRELCRRGHDGLQEWLLIHNLPLRTCALALETIRSEQPTILAQEAAG